MKYKLIQDVIAVVTPEELQKAGGIKRMAYILFGDRSYDIMRQANANEIWLYAKGMFINVTTTPSNSVSWGAAVSKSTVSGGSANVQIDLDALAAMPVKDPQHPNVSADAKEALLDFLRNTYVDSMDGSEPKTSVF